MTNLQQFYTQNPLKVWKKVLGPSMHYHFGGDNAVRVLYSYINDNSSILDVGCGWGGPATLLENEKSCLVHGVSNSEQHVNHNKQKVFLSDIHDFIPTQQYDSVLFLESLTHFNDAPKVLQQLKPYTNRIIIRDYMMTQDTYHPAWNMHVRTPYSFQQLVSQDYTILHLEEEKDMEIVETCKYWYNNIATLPFNQLHGQILMLQELCEDIINYGSPFKLVTIVADA